MHSEEAIRLVRQHLRSGASKASLAARAGVAPNVLRNVFDDSFSPNLRTLIALEKAVLETMEEERAA